MSNSGNSTPRLAGNLPDLCQIELLHGPITEDLGATLGRAFWPLNKLCVSGFPPKIHGAAPLCCWTSLERPRVASTNQNRMRD